MKTRDKDTNFAVHRRKDAPVILNDTSPCVLFLHFCFYTYSTFFGGLGKGLAQGLI